MNFSIIIPVFNEENSIQELLQQLEPYSSQHEILFVNDGSTDKTYDLLNECKFIQLYSHDRQRGKGKALRLGLDKSLHPHVILMDGDLEVHVDNISAIIGPILKNDSSAVFGSRWHNGKHGFGLFSVGNWILNSIFNCVNNSSYSDVLCCMKAFNKNDIPINDLESKTFDIEVELSSFIHNKVQNIIEVPISYNRRSPNEGKKLKLRDGFTILKRIIKPNKNKKPH